MFLPLYANKPFFSYILLCHLSERNLASIHRNHGTPGVNPKENLSDEERDKVFE